MMPAHGDADSTLMPVAPVATSCMTGAMSLRDVVAEESDTKGKTDFLESGAVGVPSQQPQQNSDGDTSSSVTVRL